MAKLTKEEKIKSRQEKAKAAAAPKLNIDGISVVRDDPKALAAFERTKTLKVSVAELESSLLHGSSQDSHKLDQLKKDLKAKKRELKSSLSDGKKYIRLLASCLYDRIHLGMVTKKKALSQQIKASSDNNASIELNEQKKELLAKCKVDQDACELDKANSLRELEGKPHVDSESRSWKIWMAIHHFLRFFGDIWDAFSRRFPLFSQFIVFLLLSNGITVLQILLQQIFLPIFNSCGLAGISFQLLAIPGATSPVTFNNVVYYTQYFIFDYFKGAQDGALVLTTLANGNSMLLPGGGGLAFFLSVQVTGALAQLFNFFAQRNITFKSHGNPWWAAMWYILAYFAIMIVSSAAQGLYKAPIYQYFIGIGWGTFMPNLLTMIIYSAISFWVFYPIFKFIFPDDKMLQKRALKKAARAAKKDQNNK